MNEIAQATEVTKKPCIPDFRRNAPCSFITFEHDPQPLRGHLLEAFAQEPQPDHHISETLFINEFSLLSEKGGMEMKIAALYPVGVEPELEEVVAGLLQGYASPGTEITPFFDSNKNFAYSGDIESRSVDAVKHAVYAEKNGFDAVLLAAL